MATPKQLLVEHIYDGNLPADVRRLVGEGKGWREIASLVTVKTGQQVSHESLRQWYGEQTADARPVREPGKAGAA